MVIAQTDGTWGLRGAWRRPSHIRSSRAPRAPCASGGRSQATGYRLRASARSPEITGVALEPEVWSLKPCLERAPSLSVLDLEADADGHLELGDLAVLVDGSTLLDDLEPVHVMDGL